MTATDLKPTPNRLAILRLNGAEHPPKLYPDDEWDYPHAATCRLCDFRTWRDLRAAGLVEWEDVGEPDWYIRVTAAGRAWYAKHSAAGGAS